MQYVIRGGYYAIHANLTILLNKFLILLYRNTIHKKRKKFQFQFQFQFQLLENCYSTPPVSNPPLEKAAKNCCNSEKFLLIHLRVYVSLGLLLARQVIGYVNGKFMMRKNETMCTYISQTTEEVA